MTPGQPSHRAQDWGNRKCQGAELGLVRCTASWQHSAEQSNWQWASQAVGVGEVHMQMVGSPVGEAGIRF